MPQIKKLEKRAAPSRYLCLPYWRIIGDSDGPLAFHPPSLRIIELDEVSADVMRAALKTWGPADHAALARRFDAQVVDEALRDMLEAGILSPLSDKKMSNPSRASLTGGKTRDSLSPCKPSLKLPPLRLLTLHVCHDCNLRCRYCYGEDGRFWSQPEYMRGEVAKRAIDLLLESAPQGSQNLNLVFMGGEPLLAFDLVRECVEYAESRADELGHKVGFSMTSNGTQFSPERIKWLNSHSVSVMVSMDGPPETQDALRCAPLGQSSTELLRPGLDHYLASRKGRVTVRATICAGHVPLVDLTRYFRDVGFGNVVLSPVTGTREQLGELSMSQRDLARYIEETKRLWRDIARRLLAGETQSEVASFIQRMDTLESRTPVPRPRRPCGAGYSSLAVAPAGEVYLCHRFVGEAQFACGNVYDGIDEQARFRLFSQCNPSNKSARCRGCTACGLCGGGCYHANWTATGDPGQRDLHHCRLTRSLAIESVRLYRRIHNAPLLHKMREEYQKRLAELNSRCGTPPSVP